MIHETQSQWITLPVDAQPMEAYWVHPETEGPWPGVIVLMEIFGVNSHIREVTERIAAEGYHALAINYYHRTTPNLELGYTEEDVTVGRSHKDRTTRQGLLADVQAAVDFLNAQPDVSPKGRFGTLGFCFGGHVGYLAAALTDISATASFYGGGIAVFCPGESGTSLDYTADIHGEILCLFGDQDPLIPISQTVVVEKTLQSAGVAHRILRYPEAGHGFFCNQRQDYNPHAAQEAWMAVKDLFFRKLSGSPPNG